MSPVCTYCSEPIVPTDKTATGPRGGIVHYRCQKRATTVSQYDKCPGCGTFSVSPLLKCCLTCSWKG